MQEYQNIPASLRGMNQWVCFRMEPNEKKGKPDKIPYNPVTGYKAKANDPNTWTDYGTASAAVRQGKYDGIGFEFGNGTFGIDLDHVIADGKFTEEALDILRTMDSYAEYSPSGTGVHILCRGTIPEGGRRRGNVEMYEAGRFFTVTGHTLGIDRDLEERTAAAAIVHQKYVQREASAPAERDPRVVVQINDTDRDLIQKACDSRNGAAFQSLWAGDISGYADDHSAADQALMNHLSYWTNGDSFRMDSLFRQSGLMREKWDKQHGRGTYGEMTIAKALETFRPWTGNRLTATEMFSTPIQNGKTASGAGTPETVEGGTAMQANTTTKLQHNPIGITRETPQPDSASAYLESGFLDDIKRFGRYKHRKTGFSNLDRLCGSLYPGLYVIGAISSLGKTTFTLQLADQLAAAGEHVLYFSLEQNRLEMVTKSISRTMGQKNKDTAVSAISIRGGYLPPEVLAAAEEYSQVAERVSIVECNFDTNINFIMEYTKSYMLNNPGVTPIIAVDYLQIVPSSDPRQSDKEKVDTMVRGLKKLQSENDLVVLVVSSLNRANYLTPIDFESFKESGGIEYTADVIWGLQLQVMNDPLFNKENKIREKRAMVKTAKAAEPRRVELVCLKNRYGISSYSCGFNYYCRMDLFEPDLYFSPEEENPSDGEGRL